MQIVGFRRKYDAGLIREEYLQEPDINSLALINQDEFEKITKYLKTSEIVFSLTLALFDDETYLGPYLVHSDGEWIWPSHLINLIGSENYLRLDHKFLAHIREKKYEITPLSQAEKLRSKLFVETNLLSL